MNLKSILVPICLSILLVSCDKKENAVELIDTAKLTEKQEEVKTIKESGPEITFAKVKHDFGQIKEGDVVDTTFEFTNTGKSPLIINSAVGSCGCTVPSPPKEPIAPGESSEIAVKFNSTGKPGLQNKVITITANTFEQIHKVSIKANVEKKAN